MRSATEPTPPVCPQPAVPPQPERSAWSDRATLPSDTAATAEDQEAGERRTSEPHAALSSATGDLPCRRQQQSDRTKRATPPANITHGRTPATDEKAPNGPRATPQHTLTHRTCKFDSPQRAHRYRRTHGIRLLYRFLSGEDERHHTATARTIGGPAYSDTNISAVGAPLV